MKIRQKINKKRQKREYSRHNENTTMVTYLNAMSFGSVSSILSQHQCASSSLCPSKL